MQEITNKKGKIWLNVVCNSMILTQNRFPKGVVDASSLETFLVWLNGALSTWPRGRCPSSLQGAWIWWPLKAPSNPDYSMILWYVTKTPTIFHQRWGAGPLNSLKEERLQKKKPFHGILNFWMLLRLIWNYLNQTNGKHCSNSPARAGLPELGLHCAPAQGDANFGRTEELSGSSGMTNSVPLSPPTKRS